MWVTLKELSRSPPEALPRMESEEEEGGEEKDRMEEGGTRLLPGRRFVGAMLWPGLTSLRRGVHK